MVVWEDGRMKKADYRRFKIETVVGANDFASMQEVVARRYGKMEDLLRPDLVLIDGGLGQLTAAREGLKKVGGEGLPILSLAKARGEKNERIYLAGRKNPIILKPTSPATHLLQRIRDEAHRFAITFHRKLRSRALLTSRLDQVIGIGEIRRATLLNRFKTLEGILAASDSELEKAGLSTQVIRELRKRLQTGSPGQRSPV